MAGQRVPWAYGVTTVPERRGDLLPRTLASLRRAGFDQPRLFVDGADPPTAAGYESGFGLEVTARNPKIRTHGNWVLAAYELYIRNPSAARYALFQDDMLAVGGLRDYLSVCNYPELGYLNLFTMPSNQGLAPRDERGAYKTGWYQARLLNSGPEGFQTGRGAVALVFSRDALTTLLASQHLVERVTDLHRGHRAVDGGIVTSMNKAGWREYVHNPSLVQHTGDVSTMNNPPHRAAVSWPGEDFDARTLITTVS